MKNAMIQFVTTLAMLQTGCLPMTNIASRLKNSVSTTTSISLLTPSNSSNQLMFIHNKPVSGNENFTLSQLSISLPAQSGAVSLDQNSTQISLAALSFGVAMVAIDEAKKLSCQATGVSIGTLPITCSLEGGTASDTGDKTKNADKKIADYITSQKQGIAEAVYFVETNVVNAKLPHSVTSRWYALEKDAKAGGGFHGVPDAIASSIRGWNLGLDFEAETIASTLVSVYQSASDQPGDSVGGSATVPPFVGPPAPKTCYCVYTVYSDENNDDSATETHEEKLGFLSEGECNGKIDNKMHPLDSESFYRYDSCQMR